MHAPPVDEHPRAFRDVVAVDDRVDGRAARHAEQGDVADALALHDGRLRVGHEGAVTHGGQAGAPHHAPDLGLHASLHVDVQQHEHVAPLERCGDRLAARDEQVLDGPAQLVHCNAVRAAAVSGLVRVR